MTRKRPPLTLVTQHGDLRVFTDANAVIGSEAVLRAYANGDVVVYTGFGNSGTWTGTCAKLTVREAKDLASALLKGVRLVEAWNARIAGEDKFRVSREGGTYFVTHRKETFPLRASTFRASPRLRRVFGKSAPVFKRECASCKAPELTGGYVVVHEKWKGPTWKDIALCKACVSKADALPTAGLRVVDPP